MPEPIIARKQSLEALFDGAAAMRVTCYAIPQCPMLLIDGHNLIGAMPDIDLAEPDDEWQLVQRLRTYCAAGKRTVTVVFDRGAGPAPSQALSGGGVTVHFAPPGVEADRVIVRLVEKSGSPGKVTVVTNDQKLAGQVRSAGGQVRSATQFAQSLTRPERRAVAPDEPKQAPHDPAFADIYAGFVAGDKDAARFGADISLDAGAWIDRLYGSDTAEAARAAHWLGRFGGPAGLAPLLDALTHRHGQVRSAALLALAELGDRLAAPAVAERLARDDSSMVREAAAQALGRLGGPAAMQALEAALSDPKAKVRKAASASLEQLRAQRRS
jgi:hypothetical protein